MRMTYSKGPSYEVGGGDKAQGAKRPGFKHGEGEKYVSPGKMVMEIHLEQGSLWNSIILSRYSLMQMDEIVTKSFIDLILCVENIFFKLVLSFSLILVSSLVIG